jgi:intraflagellar transport protein 52
MCAVRSLTLATIAVIVTALLHSFFGGTGGESKFETNINFLLEQYGVLVNADAVVRSSYYKYSHPKECLVSNGVVNREISKAAGKSTAGSGQGGGSAVQGEALTFVYPFGATLTVDKPAVPVLSTGSVSLPVNRPVCAFHGPTKRVRGKLAVLASCHMFHDNYLDKEDNSKVSCVSETPCDSPILLLLVVGILR